MKIFKYLLSRRCTHVSSIFNAPYKKDKYEHNNNACHVPRATRSREGCEDGHVVAADEDGGREAAGHEVQGGHVEGGVRGAQVLLRQRHLQFTK